MDVKSRMRFDRRYSGPMRSFSFPHEVIADPSLSHGEKRAILAEWASDACAVESFPTLRWLPGTTFPVTFSAVMDARQILDRHMAAQESSPSISNARAGRVIAFPQRRQARTD